MCYDSCIVYPTPAMTYTSHTLFPLAIAANFAAAGLLGNSPASLLSFFSSLLLGALIPGIDHANSALGRRIKPFSLLVQHLAGHRGITHTPAAWLVLTVLLFAIAALLDPAFHFLVAGLSLGYASHLFLDCLTVGGIPAAWPAKSIKVRYTAGLFKTGSIGEHVFIAGLIVLFFSIFAYFRLF